MGRLQAKLLQLGAGQVPPHKGVLGVRGIADMDVIVTMVVYGLCYRAPCVVHDMQQQQVLAVLSDPMHELRGLPVLGDGQDYVLCGCTCCCEPLCSDTGAAAKPVLQRHLLQDGNEDLMGCKG